MADGEHPNAAGVVYANTHAGEQGIDYEMQHSDPAQRRALVDATIANIHAGLLADEEVSTNNQADVRALTTNLNSDLDRLRQDMHALNVSDADTEAFVDGFLKYHGLTRQTQDGSATYTLTAKDTLFTEDLPKPGYYLPAAAMPKEPGGRNK